MKRTSVEATVRTLAAQDVRYPVAGGLAVNAYGVLRFTKGVDLMLQLERSNILRAFLAYFIPRLSRIGVGPLTNGSLTD
jgi:hypothetical protein